MPSTVAEIISDELSADASELFKKVGNDEMRLKFISAMAALALSARTEVRQTLVSVIGLSQLEIQVSLETGF